MSPVEDYLTECLHLVYQFCGRALLECHRWESVPGPRWAEAYKWVHQYVEDSDFLLHVMGAR